MRILFLVLALALVSSVRGKEALVQGACSRDGRFEVRMLQDTNREDRGPSDYVIAIYDARSNKCLLRFEDVGGIETFDQARQTSKTLWNNTSRFVVVTDSGTRHSTEIYVFNITDSSVQRVQLPDYVQNALGRVGGTETGVICGSEPVRWEGNKLHLMLTFDVRSFPNEPRLIYTCDVTLEFDSSNAARLVQVTKPKQRADQKDHSEIDASHEHAKRTETR